VLRADGTLLITADHGNAELMRDPVTHQPHTAHTIGRVPVTVVNPPAGVRSLQDGRLSDVAPTILALLGLPKPTEMTGRCLLVPADCGYAAAVPHAAD
jgi:2,3-bisphosphoglycerate-independent phosphoglycerate mutase